MDLDSLNLGSAWHFSMESRLVILKNGSQTADQSLIQSNNPNRRKPKIHLKSRQSKLNEKQWLNLTFQEECL